MGCFEINEAIPIIRYKKSQTFFKDIIIKKAHLNNWKVKLEGTEIFFKGVWIAWRQSGKSEDSRDSGDGWCLYITKLKQKTEK